MELGAGVQNNVLGCGEFGALLRWPQEASNGIVGSGEFGVFPGGSGHGSAQRHHLGGWKICGTSEVATGAHNGGVWGGFGAIWGSFEVKLEAGTQNGGVLGSASRCPKTLGDPQKGPSPRWRPGSGPEPGPRPEPEPGAGVGAEPGKLSPPRGGPRRPPAAGRGGPGPAMPPALTGGRLLLGAAPRRYRVRRAPCSGWGGPHRGAPPSP